MSFDDELRDRFRRADAATPGDALDLSTTMARGRRQRYARILAGAVAAAAIGAAVVLVVDRGPTSGDGGVPAAATPGQEPSPESGPPKTLVPHPAVAQGSCSAAAEAEPLEADPELPENVRYMWANIVLSAWNCDYAELEKLAGTTLGDDFEYSYGEYGDPAGYWERLETSSPGEPVTASLVRLLTMRWGVEQLQLDDDPEEERLYVWPRAAVDESEENWEELIDAGLHDRAEVEQMREDNAYYGYRVGIVADGDWIYFVAGD